MKAHEIDYKIYGSEMQYIEIELDPREVAVAESGSFMMMESGIRMETIFGDGSERESGIFGKLLSAGKRVLTGENLFMTAYENTNYGKSKVYFASPYPGKIIPIDLNRFQGKFICQKDAFLCAAKGVQVGIEFNKKISTGFFGGEGFIMQKLEGDGMAFVHAGGTLMEKVLAPGETIKVDTGCVVGYTRDVQFDVEFVGGLKNSIFGGEGLFFAVLRGPGTVYLQSLPFSRLADRIIAASPRAGGGRREEGGVLGGIGGLLNGDNRF